MKNCLARSLAVFLLVSLPITLGSQPPTAGWLSIGPPGGSIADLEFHPFDHTRLYALSSSRFSQLFLSEDAGESWTRIFTFPEKVYDLAISASDPSTMCAFGYSALFKSTDGGFAWTRSLLPFFTEDDGEIALDPTDPDIIFVAARVPFGFQPVQWCPAVYKSFDGGVTWLFWTLVYTPGIPYCLAINPSQPSEIYVGIGYEGSSAGAVFKSEEGGGLWTNVSGTIGGHVRSLRIDPSDPRRVFAGTHLGVYRSADAGTTWLPNEGQISALCLTLDPLSPNILYAGGTDALHKSLDGGIRWGRYDLAPAGEFKGLLSAGIKVHAGAAAGLFMSRDGGLSWSEAQAGFMASDIKHLAVAPSRPAVLYAATKGIAWRSDNCGASWRKLPEFTSSHEAQKFTVHPSDPDHVFAVVKHVANPSGGINTNVLESRDGGLTWRTLFQGQYLDVLINPERPDHIFIGASDLHTMGLMISLDGGATFTHRHVEQVLYGDPMTIAVNPQDDRTIYVGGDYWTGSAYEAGVFKSMDGGETWANLTTDQFAGWGFIHKVVVDPWRPDIVYLRHNKSFYKSVDAGETWEKAAPFDIEDFALDPAYPDRLYAAGDSSPYLSLNGGATWEDLSGGMASQDFSTVAVAPVFRTVFAGTYGGGLFKLRQEDVYGLSVLCGNGGQTAPPAGSYTYPWGTETTITATPSTGYTFRGWDGDAAGTENPLSVVLDDDKAIAARFWLTAPRQFKVARHTARTLFLVRSIDVLTWQPIAGVPDVAGYRIYRRVGDHLVFTAEVGPSVGSYWHTVIPSSDYGSYVLVAVNVAGEEGEPVTASLNVIVPEPKRRAARVLIRR